MREPPVPLPAAPLLDVRLHDGISAVLDQLAAAADARHALLRKAWFEAAAGEGASTLVAFRRDGRIIAALPSVPIAPRLIGARAVPGSYWPFRSFPVAADATESEIRAFLASPATRRALGRAVRIGPVNADDPTIARLARIAPSCGWTVLARRIAPSFRLDIVGAREAGPWPRGSTLRKNRFHEKHLAAHGTLEWRFVSGSGWTPDVFDDLAEIERRSWLGERGGDAKFADPRRRAVWEGLVKDPVLADMMTAGLLHVGGRPAAFSFGIDCGPTRYCVATSYDRAFARHSPGKLLGYRTYMDAADRGIERLDDGAGDGGHKATMGEVPGPDIMDYLFVRGALAGKMLRPIWERRWRLRRRRRPSAERSG